MIPRLAAATLVVAASLLVACGGGGGSSSGGGPVSVTVTPTPTPTSPIQLFLADAEGNPINEPSPGVLGVNTISMPFTSLGATQYVLVYEVGFLGTFYANPINCYDYGTTSGPNPQPTLVGTNPTVSVTPATSTGQKSALFTITSIAAGVCNVKISDATNGASILVDVTTTTGTISSVHRHI